MTKQCIRPCVSLSLCFSPLRKSSETVQLHHCRVSVIRTTAVSVCVRACTCVYLILSFCVLDKGFWLLACDCSCVCVCVYVCVCVCVCVCVSVCISYCVSVFWIKSSGACGVCVAVCVCVCMCVCVCVCVCVCL